MSSFQVSSKRSGDNEDPPQNTNAEADKRDDAGDVPFLVTHWLEQFAKTNAQKPPNQDQAEAFERIKRATSEIASAFSTLGVYGPMNQPQLSATNTTSRQHEQSRNASYADRSRQWSRLPDNHLSNLIHSVIAANSAADGAAMASRPAALLVEANERLGEQPDGRSSLDAIALDDTGTGDIPATINSSLQFPVLLNSKPTPRRKSDIVPGPQASTSGLPTISLGSTLSEIHSRTSVSMRRLLSLREKIRQDDDEIGSLRASLSRQEDVLKSLAVKRSTTLISEEWDEAKRLSALDEIKEGEQNCNRVIAQLRRRLIDLDGSNRSRREELRKVEADAREWNGKGVSVNQYYRDPFRTIDRCRASGNRMGGNMLLDYICHRQRGKPMSSLHASSTCEQINYISKEAEATSIRRAILSTRLSHAATINVHLSFPVYCLRFDRTGRYFITGADDYLIKVFYLGAARSCRDKNDRDGSRELRCNYGANARGAVLVCTLRGHAGVINDIDVSSDNCFLATASVDGDCRIWGLKDGCPVAVLRGHKGGANMVSWSTLTPYRLITTGSDGYARLWDIREATLKRYGAVIGKRPEYRLLLTEKEKEVEKQSIVTQGEAEEPSAAVDILPPLPMRENAASGNADGETTTNDMEAAQPQGVAALPLPPGNEQEGIQNGGAQAANDGGNNNIVPGAFVANDNIDEGVKLLSKYQHGAPESDAQAGPGTRSRRAAVNVICVARCPIGGHFATGSDDGICRVWEGSEDHCVELVDKRYSFNPTRRKSIPQQARRSTRLTSLPNGSPLLKLMGHVSAITDLAYSRLGDRILSASQRDGNVRVWSVGTKMDSLAVGEDSVVERGVTQIVIKLTNPIVRAKSVQPQSRRRAPGNSSRNDTTKISCDVAVWTHDDTKIVTSQSILVKLSGNEIQPGSQYLFLWDSHTGHCLVGISGAHSMQCPVVIPHPADVSLVCSAGADGVVNIWDWEGGKCVFSHRNKVEFGPPDVPTRPKTGGYLDGAFSPDGTSLVLTDDLGRVTILDSCAPVGTSVTNTAPLWMREQYFANDYYELFYDSNGYCIERGSEQPPHLAPKGVRSTHAGAPLPDHVNETFQGLVGPTPLPAASCRWRRDAVRERRQNAANRREDSSKPRISKLRSGVREFDPVNTIIVRGPDHVEANGKRVAPAKGPHHQRASPDTTDMERSMSSNFRWGDYEDLMRDQGNDEDDIESDDEEFEPSAPRGSYQDTAEDSEEDLDPDDVDGYSPRRRVGRSQGSGRSVGERSRRAQRRSQRRDNQFVEIGSDDEMVAQFVSTNTSPSGPFLRDYNVSGHLWRLTGNGTVNRKWLHRVESTTSYNGRKVYSPQVGDTVIYIPRAHFETIKEFPNLTPPWQRWPQGTVWPVVRCCVRGVRYRFPYEGFSSRRQRSASCRSIVAILSLELTGIPELSGGDDFPWPTPSFVHPTRSHCFEISIFENDKSEFIIPEALYTKRLLALEKTLNNCDRRFEGLDIQLYYAGDSDQEDPEMQLYPATINGVDTDDSHPDPHLRGSGFCVLEVECEGYSDFMSPWEVITDEAATPDRPTLSQDDKKLILESLEAQLQKSSVMEYLADPVDLVRYSDYMNMVEIPIDLMFIKERVQYDYYGSKFGVVADVKLVRDNCIKYNGNEGFLSQVSSGLYDEFLKYVLTDEEQQHVVSDELLGDFDTQPIPSLRIRLRTRGNSTGEQSSQLTNPSRNRLRTRRDSALENLPPPQDNRLGRRELRQEPESNAGRRSNRSRGATLSSDGLGRTSGRRCPNQTGEDNDDDGSTEMQSEAASEESQDSDDQHEQRPTRSRRLSGEVAVPGARTLRSQPVSNGHSNTNRDNERSTAREESGRFLRTRNSSRRYAERDEESMSSDDEDEEPESELDDDNEEENWDDGSDKDSNDPDEKWDNPSPVRQRAASRARRRPSRLASIARSRPVDEEPSSPRRSNRAAKYSHGTYEEKGSDYDLESEEDSEEDGEEMSTKRRSRHTVTYAEVPSDFDESSDGSVDDEESHEGNAGRTKRQRDHSNPIQNNSKRTKRDDGLPVVKEWPEIEIKDITEVARGILERIRVQDTEHAFAIPVLESYPELADAYAAKVSDPIDLRTIEEEKIFVYQSIRELRDDLILMFRNACKYNNKNSHYWKYSKAIWESLTDVFRETCEDANVLLPRRF